MTISINRLSYLCLAAIAEAKPVWARAAGIETASVLGEPVPHGLAKTLGSLRSDVQRTRSGDALERSLLLGTIDSEVAAIEARTFLRDPSQWLEAIARTCEAPNVDRAAAMADAPRFLEACIRESAPLSPRLVERARTRGAEVEEWLRSDVTLVPPSAWRELEGDAPILGEAVYERLFRAIHRLNYPAKDLLGAALEAVAFAALETPAAPAASEDLGRAVEDMRARWPVHEAVIDVLPAPPRRPSWLGPYIPHRSLDPSSRAVLYPSGPAKLAAMEFGYPGEHALRSAKQATDLRRVTAAPAAVRGWRAFVATELCGAPPRLADAVLAAADAALHAGMWEFDETVRRLTAASEAPVAWIEPLVVEAWGEPAVASSAFVGRREYVDLWQSTGAPLETFIRAVLATGPLPLPLAAGVIERAVRAAG